MYFSYLSFTDFFSSNSSSSSDFLVSTSFLSISFIPFTFFCVPLLLFLLLIRHFFALSVLFLFILLILLHLLVFRFLFHFFFFLDLLAFHILFCLFLLFAFILFLSSLPCPLSSSPSFQRRTHKFTSRSTTTRYFKLQWVEYESA